MRDFRHPVVGPRRGHNEAMTEEVFTWDPSSNNRMLLAGHGLPHLELRRAARRGDALRKLKVLEEEHLAATCSSGGSAAGARGGASSGEARGAESGRAGGR